MLFPFQASNGSPGSQDGRISFHFISLCFFFFINLTALKLWKTSTISGQVIVVRSQHDLTTRLQAASNASRLAILYFTATWCGPCRAMAPLFEKLAQKHPQVVFMKLDIDQLGSVAQEWNVTSVPTFFFVKNGKTVDTVLGADKNGLERSIALHAK